MSTPSTPRAFGHVRTSTLLVKSPYDAESQIRATESEAQRRDLHIVRIFSDLGIPGSENGRAQFEAMMQLATGPDRPVDAIITMSLARLSRDLHFLTKSCAQLKQAGVELVFP